ncbi:hypothetical protein OIU79_018767 [Salix purpurea]|uniref:Uncharacterized protein n=1 Tax=Salix purpurea TaxID=77065 RepID=A0A9Q0X0M7_SALPP|nr:hypothetical protein OIU79_018767 [Salix purpurea]
MVWCSENNLLINTSFEISKSQYQKGIKIKSFWAASTKLKDPIPRALIKAPNLPLLQIEKKGRENLWNWFNSPQRIKKRRIANLPQHNSNLPA